MPEGPECRHITDVLKQYCLGKTINHTQILSGRYLRHGDPVGYSLLTESSLKIIEIGVKGKFIWWKLEREKDTKTIYLFNTLGMSGQWTNRFDKHCRVVFGLSDGSNIYFRDIRNFGTLKVIQEETLFKKKIDSLGVDILNNKISKEEIIKLFRKRPGWTLPKFLMNQNYFSGIGNYLKCEALHRARLSPHLEVREIKDDKLVELFYLTCQIAEESYRAKGASFKTYSDPDSNKGKYSFQFQVYGQKTFNDLPIIVEKTLDGRTTHWCPDYLNSLK